MAFILYQSTTLKMKQSLKKLLFQNSSGIDKCFYILTALIICTSIGSSLFCQTHANFVTNGSFEIIKSCDSPFIDYKAKGWNSVDSSKFIGELLNVKCSNAPYTPVGFQNAKHGAGYIRLQLFYQGQNTVFTRSNLKNRLKSNLKGGKTYCAKMFLNVQDSCAIAIDAVGMYFCNESIDTIKYNARLPLTFLNPQISNPTGNYINDTMNWIAVSGTFVATGNEKYMVIANFKSDANTNTVTTGVILSPNPPFSVYFLDAVSCIEVDAPAYAGNDKLILAGDSVYIGREADYAVDPYCVWYQLPNMTTSLDTISGLWVKPTVTSTYVVKQNLDCGSEKWDTVVVYVDYVGIDKIKSLNEKLKIFPIPADDIISIEYKQIENEQFSLAIVNQLGEVIREEEIVFKGYDTKINIKDLQNGVYFLQLSGKDGVTNKRFVIAR